MMAESIGGKTLDKLEGEITCGICQEHYTEPKVLPCLHYYCKECVVKLASKAGSRKPFSCPECRCDTKLPEGGVDSLKTAFFVNRLKTTITTMERAQGKVEMQCELCTSGDKAVSFCRQCAMFVCDSCTKQHQKIKIFISHDIALLEDLKHGRAQPIVTKELASPMKCEDHEEPLIIYCFECETLICHHCTVKDHRDHNFEFCKKAATNTKKELLEKLQPLKNRTSVLSTTLQNVQSVKDTLEVQSRDLSEAIKTSFRRLRGILDKREGELLADASRIAKNKVDKLTVQEKNLSLAHAEMQSVVDCTEQCVQHCSDGEVMSMLTEIQHRIEHQVEQCKTQTVVESVEDSHIAVEVNCEEALLELVQTQATVTDVFPIDSDKCTLNMRKAIPEIDVENTATLTLKDAKDALYKISGEVSCNMKSLYNNVLTVCEVDKVTAGVYAFRHTPTVRGRHEVIVRIDGNVLENTFPFLCLPLP